MAYAHPDDGFAYSAIELVAWVKIVENWQVVAKDLERPYEAHMRLADRNLPTVAGIDDARAAELIKRAVRAEMYDPDPFAANDDDTSIVVVTDLPEPNDPNPYGGHA